ncbi:MAG: undecaprenyl-diphosphate phosphatase [Patescibacteria group bacterium]
MTILSQLIQGAVLGAVQGFAEFLPVSSSGHLILVPTLLRWEDQGLAFDVILHLGTLLALLWCFWGELLGLAKNAVMPSATPAETSHARDLIVKVAVAAVPALILGYAFNDWLESYARNAMLIAFNLAVWATVLWYADSRAKAAADVSILATKISWRQALSVAFSQPLALLPGTSRSGITITAGLLSGMPRALAAKFSFFVSIPVTAAAGGYGLLKLLMHGGIEHPLKLAVGFVTAAATGIFAIRLLLRYVSKDSYVPFVFYRYALAVVVLLVT